MLISTDNLILEEWQRSREADRITGRAFAAPLSRLCAILGQMRDNPGVFRPTGIWRHGSNGIRAAQEARAIGLE